MERRVWSDSLPTVFQFGASPLLLGRSGWAHCLQPRQRRVCRFQPWVQLVRTGPRGCDMIQARVLRCTAGTLAKEAMKAFHLQGDKRVCWRLRKRRHSASED
eukprot:g676.t1